MNDTQFWFDTDLIHVLSTLSVSEFNVEDTDPGAKISLTVELDPAQTLPLLQERQEYLRVAREESPDPNEAIEQLVSEIETALDIEYNTVGHDPAPSGQYQRINDNQWEKTDEPLVYDTYSDILFELTGNDIDYDEHTPSVPELREPFLTAAAASPDHELPPPGAVRTIITTHLQQLRETNQSRIGVMRLKQELEHEGVNPRSAARIANNMDEYLLEDDEIQTEHESGEHNST